MTWTYDMNPPGDGYYAVLLGSDFHAGRNGEPAYVVGGYYQGGDWTVSRYFTMPLEPVAWANLPTAPSVAPGLGLGPA
jgi:hypothetical protein